MVGSGLGGEKWERNVVEVRVVTSGRGEIGFKVKRKVEKV